MKIYICECYHDNDCGVFNNLEDAVKHFGTKGCDGEELAEYDTDNLESDSRHLKRENVIHDCGFDGCSNRYYREDAKAIKDKALGEL